MNQLLTGIPRSGTTLCCKLLNQVLNTVALHEPLDPQKLCHTSSSNSCEEIQSHINNLRNSLLVGAAFEHGDRSGIELDNPVSVTNNEQRVRQLQAQRGLLSLPKQAHDFHLIVKQNALFAALADALSAVYPMIAVVRNPIFVLLSWMTVDLPVNKGRLPAGEKFCSDLAQKLSMNEDVFNKQLIIYNWFLRQYENANITIIRYEDIISSQGQTLYEAFDIYNAPMQALSHPERQFPIHAIKQIQVRLNDIASELASSYYSQEDIKLAFASIFKNAE